MFISENEKPIIYLGLIGIFTFYVPFILAGIPAIENLMYSKVTVPTAQFYLNDVLYSQESCSKPNIISWMQNDWINAGKNVTPIDTSSSVYSSQLLFENGQLVNVGDNAEEGCKGEYYYDKRDGSIYNYVGKGISMNSRMPPLFVLLTVFCGGGLFGFFIIIPVIALYYLMSALFLYLKTSNPLKNESPLDEKNII